MWHGDDHLTIGKRPLGPKEKDTRRVRAGYSLPKTLWKVSEVKEVEIKGARRSYLTIAQSIVVKYCELQHYVLNGKPNIFAGSSLS